MHNENLLVQLNTQTTLFIVLDFPFFVFAALHIWVAAACRFVRLQFILTARVNIDTLCAFNQVSCR